MNQNDKCPICHRSPWSYELQSDVYAAKCSLCGHYRFTSTPSSLRDALRTHSPSMPLACALRQAWEAGSPLTLSPEIIDQLIANHGRPSVPANLDRLLGHIAGQLAGVNDKAILRLENDFPVIDATDGEELRTYLSWLVAENLVNVDDLRAPVMSVWLLKEGWKRIRSDNRPGGAPGTCFVAMWFDSSMTEAYEIGIKPAIETDCDLKAIRIDRVEHNNQITDEIMAGIRGAEFLVADFTGHRAGVYYEAGFARGLGRTVIYTCREDSFDKRHFDTSVINHIVWKDPADLRTKLANRIKATVLPRA